MCISTYTYVLLMTQYGAHDTVDAFGTIVQEYYLPVYAANAQNIFALRNTQHSPSVNMSLLDGGCCCTVGR